MTDNNTFLEISPANLREAMGESAVILVKNYFFILLHKFNLHNHIYDSLKF